MSNREQRIKKIFLGIFLCLTFYSVQANPLYTPGVPSEIGEPNGETLKNTEQDKTATPLHPVRTSGASPELIGMQRNFRDRVGDLLYLLKEAQKDGTSAAAFLLPLFIFSFIYGILHAAGPGHRKSLVFSFYLTRSAPLWEPFAASAILAFLHGGTAVVLILLLKEAVSSLGASADIIGIYLEGFSYILIIFTALILLIKEIREFMYFRRRSEKAEHNKNDGGNKAAKNLSLTSLFLSGLYPCPGAILVLILSYTLDILNIGIICVFIMSAGMALPVCAAAYLAWCGKKGIFILLKKNTQSAALMSFIVEAFGFILLIAFSLYIALPFFKNFI